MVSMEIFIFIHIFKTGGNTLTRQIERYFPKHQVYAGRGAEILTAEKADLVQYRYATGHYPYSVHKFFPSEPTFGTILRDPVDRALSVYGYTRSRTEAGEIHRIAQTSTIEEFIAHELIGTHISNVMTLFLSADPDLYLSRSRPMNRDDLELAKNRLQDMAFVGLTERFDESMTMLRKYFGWPRENSKVEAVNVTPNPVRRDDVSDAIIEQLGEMNQLDLELYAFAKEIFEQKLMAS